MTRASAVLAHHVTPRTLAPSATRTRASSGSPGQVLILELVLSAPTRSRALCSDARPRRFTRADTCTPAASFVPIRATAHFPACVSRAPVPVSLTTHRSRSPAPVFSRVIALYGHVSVWSPPAALLAARCVTTRAPVALACHVTPPRFLAPPGMCTCVVASALPAGRVPVEDSPLPRRPIVAWFRPCRDA
ncbi:hypothetical protein FS749_009664 [Ceratobasidium sp. UAMH 11750]|nr:hypothetical protein FS749_009664 [Ceratobasidium sp. UAMH 11750]